MKSINVLTRKDVEEIIDIKIKKVLNFRVSILEKSLDKLRQKLNDIEIISHNFKK